MALGTFLNYMNLKNANALFAYEISNEADSPGDFASQLRGTLNKDLPDNWIKHDDVNTTIHVFREEWNDNDWVKLSELKKERQIENYIEAKFKKHFRKHVDNYDSIKRNVSVVVVVLVQGLNRIVEVKF